VAPLGTNNSFFSPASFFANGEQGWWYDPSNFATLFQDSAGTTPVTAVEQPVGLQLDLSQNGVNTNGAFRYNLLIQTDDLNSADYPPFQVTKTVGGVVGPLGRNGTTWREVAVTSIHIIDGTPPFSVTSGATYTASIYVKPAGRTRVRLNAGSAWNNVSPNAYYELTGSGSVDNLDAGVTATITPADDGWYRLTLSVAANVTSSTAKVYLSLVLTGTTINYAGDITKGVDVFGYQVNAGASALTYQRVNADWPSTIPGNHRFQTNSGNRPVVSALVNLLTKTEQFSNAVWFKSGVTLGSLVTAPDGTTTAQSITYASGGGVSNFQYFNAAPIGVTPLGSIYIRASTPVTMTFGFFDGSGFDAPVSVTSTWTRFEYAKATPLSSADRRFWLYPTNAGSNITVEIWHPDCRPTNQGVGLPAYQRVNTSTDYDSTGFPIYIKPNGSNQFMQTNSINFTATDKMTVWQGVRKLSDAATGRVAEISVNAAVNAGAFAITAPEGAASNYGFFLRGDTGYPGYSATTFAAPVTNVLSVAYDISGAAIADEIKPRINGATPTLGISAAGPAGTGNFGNYPAYFYMRAGSSLPFGGNDYGSIARGAASTAAQITNGETYINTLTKAYT
jgi:hypothetical protein